MSVSNKESTTKNLNKKSSLGRGLGSLLGGSNLNSFDSVEKKSDEIEVAKVKTSSMKIERHSLEVKQDSFDKVLNIETESLVADSKQPRKHFEKTKLKELADSIKEQGILIPIIVRRKDKELIIVAGERRWRAAKLIGLKKVPVILKKVEDKQALELAIIENIQRHDLNPVEEALAYQALIQKHEMTQQDVATKVGRDRSSIANSLRLLSLPEDVVTLISENKISFGHAKVLLGLGDPNKQSLIAKRIKEDNLSVRATEQLIKKEQALIGLTKKGLSSKEDSDVEVKKRLLDQVVGEIQKVLRSKVNIDYRQGKGKISLHFYSDEQLNQLIEQMKLAWKR